MTAQQIITTRSLRSEFSSMGVASSFITRSVNPSKFCTVLGDNGRFWVLSNRDASVLVKAGFQYAN